MPRRFRSLKNLRLVSAMVRMSPSVLGKARQVLLTPVGTRGMAVSTATRVPSQGYTAYLVPLSAPRQLGARRCQCRLSK